MNRYRNPALRQLTEQQVRYAPREVRLSQMARAEQLIPTLEASEQYYYVDLCEEMTGFRTDRYPDLIVSGEEALHDLRCFVEDLSASVGQLVEQAGEPVVMLEELCARFQVSEKTVQRWRDRGLSSRWFRVESRMRLGFLESSVQRFAARNAADVDRGASFRQVEPAEREQILRRARRLARYGASLAEIARRLARRFRRSPETIRYTVRSHDEQFPTAAVFPQWKSRMTEEARRELFRSFRRGVSAERIAQQFGCTKSTVYRVFSEERARRLVDQTIEFVPSAEFDRAELEEEILAPIPGSGATDEESSPPPGLPPYLAALYNIPVLGRDEESRYFRKMNYLKHRAIAAQKQINLRRPRTSVMDEMEEFLRKSHEVKNFLIRSNLRLVVSIARRHLKPGGNFFEMVSDGNMALISAIERFDYSKGNKFSTYATWSIMKAFARNAPTETAFQQRFRTGREELLELSSDLRTAPPTVAVSRQQHQALLSILDQLDGRERDIIMYRFGIGAAQEPETLDQVGRRLGVTKERIRQLEARALQKLRRLAIDEKLEMPELPVRHFGEAGQKPNAQETADGLLCS